MFGEQHQQAENNIWQEVKPKPFYYALLPQRNSHMAEQSRDTNGKAAQPRLMGHPHGDAICDAAPHHLFPTAGRKAFHQQPCEN